MPLAFKRHFKPLKLSLRLFLKKEIQVVPSPMLKICSTSKSRKLCYILGATKYAYENVAGNSVVLRGFCFLLLGDFSSLATLLQWKSPWKSSHLVCHTHTLLFYTHNTLISIFQWVPLLVSNSRAVSKKRAKYILRFFNLGSVLVR